MKKSFKFLAVFAFVFAVGASFAAKGVESSSQTGYYDDPNFGATLVPGGVDCSTTLTQNPICKYSTYDVFADEGLSVPMYKINP